MMETDIEKMYLNLNELLEDICTFFSHEKLGILSPKDQRLAETLISRCKVQLQAISKIQRSTEEYVDMDKKKDDKAEMEIPIAHGEIVSPYQDLPVKEASRDIKYGTLSIKKRIWLGFEKMKRGYATIHNQWLLVYSCEKDIKPICTFDLKMYKAKEANRDKSTNFELMSVALTDRKIYYFMALTHKDMLQWVSHINRCHNTVPQSKTIYITDTKKLTDEDDEDDISEQYDSIIPQNTVIEEEEEDDIYLELDDMVQPSSQNNNTIIPKKIPVEKYDPRPPLPGRVPLPGTRPLPGRRPLPEKEPVEPPVASLSNENSDNESLASYDDIVNKDETIVEAYNRSLVSLDDSFSDDDEDSIYEAFVNVNRQQSKSLPPQQIETNDANITHDNSNTQEETKIPKLPPKPKVKDKPAISKKPLVFSKSSTDW